MVACLGLDIGRLIDALLAVQAAQHRLRHPCGSVCLPVQIFPFRTPSFLDFSPQLIFRALSEIISLHSPVVQGASANTTHPEDLMPEPRKPRTMENWSAWRRNKHPHPQRYKIRNIEFQIMMK